MEFAEAATSGGKNTATIKCADASRLETKLAQNLLL